MEKAAEHSRSAAPRRGFKNRLLMNVPRPGLYRLASASRERESKMLFHQRNNSSVATRTQVFRRRNRVASFAKPWDVEDPPNDARHRLSFVI